MRDTAVPALPQSRLPRDVVTGARIRVKQRVTVGARSWVLEITGVVREIRPMDTGIHTDRVRKDEIWVESVLLEKPDGELSRVTVDQNTQIEVLPIP